MTLLHHLNGTLAYVFTMSRYFIMPKSNAIFWFPYPERLSQHYAAAPLAIFVIFFFISKNNNNININKRNNTCEAKTKKKLSYKSLVIQAVTVLLNVEIVIKFRRITITFVIYSFLVSVARISSSKPYKVRIFIRNNKGITGPFERYVYIASVFQVRCTDFTVKRGATPFEKCGVMIICR